MTLSIIAAISINNTIGFKNTIVWNIKQDRIFFKNITKNGVVVMGRLTYESLLTKPLINRVNIILSRNKHFLAKNCLIFTNIKDMLDFIKKYDKIFIIGGSQIYYQTIDIVDKLYITFIKKNYIGDTFFPKIKEKKWKLVSEYIFNSEYSFREYIKK
ncbi:MAG: dihydrofolate reductase [Bacteroides sp.]|nr:MAG: dihydrofolate reductase [Bacteroides sp.]